MDKTLRKKLTGEYLNAFAPALSGFNREDTSFGIPAQYSLGLGHEINILQGAAKDLLQPRPEAIARLLKMAKDL